MMKFGNLIALLSVNQKKRSSFTWVLREQSASSRQSGISLSSETGSITAPDRMCAPTSEPFSTTTMLKSALSCFSRIAAARPDGPAPTITTSNSMDSRGGNSSVLIIYIPARLGTLPYEARLFPIFRLRTTWKYPPGRFVAAPYALQLGHARTFRHDA